MDAAGTDAGKPASRPVFWLGLTAVLALPAYLAAVYGIVWAIPAGWPNEVVAGVIAVAGVGSPAVGFYGLFRALTAAEAVGGRSRAVRLGVYSLEVLAGVEAVAGLALWPFLWWVAFVALLFRGWNGPG